MQQVTGHSPKQAGRRMTALICKYLQNIGENGNRVDLCWVLLGVCAGRVRFQNYRLWWHRTPRLQSMTIKVRICRFFARRHGVVVRVVGGNSNIDGEIGGPGGRWGGAWNGVLASNSQ